MIENFALIIGAMKCGTTSLFEYLAQHPQICPSCEKEPDFFTDDDKWAKGIEWYERLWNWDSDTHTIALEASTSYTKLPAFPNAAERIAPVRRSFRFIYMLRDPIRRIQSHYRHGLRDGWIPPEVAVEETVQRHAIDISRYAMQIEEYYKRFASVRIMLLALEDLNPDPVGVLQAVCRFLRVDPAFRFRGLAWFHNPSNRIDSTLYTRASQNPLLKTIAGIVPARPKEVLRNLMGHRSEEPFHLSARQRAFVLHELHDDLCKLSREYGFDVSRWGIEV